MNKQKQKKTGEGVKCKYLGLGGKKRRQKERNKWGDRNGKIMYGSKTGRKQIKSVEKKKIIWKVDRRKMQEEEIEE